MSAERMVLERRPEAAINDEIDLLLGRESLQGGERKRLHTLAGELERRWWEHRRGMEERAMREGGAG